MFESEVQSEASEDVDSYRDSGCDGGSGGNGSARNAHHFASAYLCWGKRGTLRLAVYWHSQSRESWVQVGSLSAPVIRASDSLAPAHVVLQA